jgi:hypothetical protein
MDEDRRIEADGGLPELVEIKFAATTSPAAPSSRIANSASRTAALASGSGTDANSANRPGWLWQSSDSDSFISRCQRAAIGLGKP